MKYARSVVLSIAVTCFLFIGQARAYECNDAHVHVTNYVQRGLTTEEMLQRMGDKVGRSVLFGIPLQQKWDHALSGDVAPTYYLHSDAELYYYSFIDAMIAEDYLRLPPADRKRFDPMITGFNPSDMYAVDHIRRVLTMYPGVFEGIGEFTINKEFVSSKIAGSAASLRNPALHRILSLAGDIGLVVILHSDVSTVISPLGDKPAFSDDLKDVFKAHKNTTIIWAHTGLGRIVKPAKDHLALLKELLSSPEYAHVLLDISWDEVAKYVTADQASVAAWAKLINAYPDRFLFGSDAVAPKDQEAYLKTYRDYEPLWKALDPKTARMVKQENYVRIFDEARRRVREWEKKELKGVQAAPRN